MLAEPFGPCRIEKGFVHKEAGNDRDGLEKIMMLTQYFMERPSPKVVPILGFQVLKESRNHYTGNPYFRYAYQMQRLHDLTKDEESCIARIRPPYDSRFHGGMPRGHHARLDSVHGYDLPKLKNFMVTLYNEALYEDHHCANIMKDDAGDYRIIDLEGFFAKIMWRGSLVKLSREHLEDVYG